MSVLDTIERPWPKKKFNFSEKKVLNKRENYPLMRQSGYSEKKWLKQIEAREKLKMGWKNGVGKEVLEKGAFFLFHRSW